MGVSKSTYGLATKFLSGEIVACDPKTWLMSAVAEPTNWNWHEAWYYDDAGRLAPLCDEPTIVPCSPVNKDQG